MTQKINQLLQNLSDNLLDLKDELNRDYELTTEEQNFTIRQFRQLYDVFTQDSARIKNVHWFEYSLPIEEVKKAMIEYIYKYKEPENIPYLAKLSLINQKFPHRIIESFRIHSDQIIWNVKLKKPSQESNES